MRNIILDICQTTFCRWCRYGIPWLACAVNITEIFVHSTPAHLFFMESFFPKLFFLLFQLPELLDCRLVGPNLVSQILYWLVSALLQRYHRVPPGLHCAMWLLEERWTSRWVCIQCCTEMRVCVAVLHKCECVSRNASSVAVLHKLKWKESWPFCKNARMVFLCNWEVQEAVWRRGVELYVISHSVKM